MSKQHAHLAKKGPISFSCEADRGERLRRAQLEHCIGQVCTLDACVLQLDFRIGERGPGQGCLQVGTSPTWAVPYELYLASLQSNMCTMVVHTRVHNIC